MDNLERNGLKLAKNGVSFGDLEKIPLIS